MPERPMDWKAEVRARLARGGVEPDEDVVEEMAQHASAAFERARADGVDSGGARDRVLTMIDAWCQDPAPYGRRPRPAPALVVPESHARGFTGLTADLRYGLRQLTRQPGFSLTAILVSALGIGAATTIFSVAYGVLLRPLPWPDAGRLVRISEVREGATRSFGLVTTNATYLAWRDDPATLSGLAAYGTDTVALGLGDDVEQARVLRATASLFDVLSARPALGAVFTAADERPGGGQVVVLSHRIWQRRLGGRQDVIGQSIELDGERRTIIGVMPEGFFFPGPEIAAWAPRFVPTVLSATNPNSRSISLFNGVGRLRPGVTADQASADGTARSRGGPDLGMVGIAMFGTKGAPTVTATPYLASVTADVEPALVVLLWAVGLLVAAGTANIAGMQLARAVGRRREIAIRTALGAGTGRLARQLLTESAVVGLAGGLGGLLITIGLHRTLPSILPPDFPRLDDVAVDWRVMAFAMGVALLATLVVGLIPSRIARRLNLVETLTEDSLAPVGTGLRSHAGRTRAVVMAGQVAVAAVLLVGASLLTRSFVALMNVDRGYDPTHLLTAEIPLPDRRFTGPKRAALLDDLVARLRAVPGVRTAAAANVTPLVSRDMVMGFTRPPAPGQTTAPADVHASVRHVSPGYFEALGIRIVLGRAFDDSDSLASAPAILVNEAFASRYLTGDPLGQRLPITFDQDRDVQQTIIGVVRDAQHSRATDPPQPQVYANYRQLKSGMDFSAPMILIRTAGDPAAFAPTLERLVRDRDRSLAPQSVMTMENRLGTSLARPRLYALLLGGFAGFAVLVCGIGLFGALSHSVTQRRREIGIRAALGARPIDVVRLIVGQSLALTLAGAVTGLVTAWLLARHVSTLLYGVTMHDAVSFGLVPILLVAAAILAALAPARRAAKVDPLTALRPK